MFHFFLAILKQVSEVSSIIGRAGTVSLGKAVDVLDTLGSSMTNLNISGFGSSTTTKGTKISILAFEVANTIVKGCSLMRALSKDSIKHLKETVLHSEGVQNLISKDMDELLKISAADKRLVFNLHCIYKLQQLSERFICFRNKFIFLVPQHFCSSKFKSQLLGARLRVPNGLAFHNPSLIVSAE